MDSDERKPGGAGLPGGADRLRGGSPEESSQECGLKLRIAELERALERARGAHARLAAQIETEGVGRWNLDLASDRLEVSNTAARLAGIPEGDGTLAAGSLLECLPATARMDWAAWIEGEAGDAWQVDFPRRSSGGLWLRMRATLLLDAAGRPCRCEGILLQVPSPEQADAALADAAELLRSVCQASPDFIINVGREGRINFLNRVQPGLEPDRVIGTPMWGFVREDDHAPLRQALEEVFETGETRELETHGDGPWQSPAAYNSRLGPVFKDGRVVSVTLVATDITRLQRTERVLAASTTFLHKVLDATPDLLCILNVADFSLDYANPGVAHVLDYTPEALRAMQGTLLQRLVHPDDLPRTRQIRSVLPAMDRNTVREIDLRLRDRAGAWHWLHARYVVFSDDEAGVPNQVLVAAIDITDRKTALAALGKSQERLKLATESVGIGVFDYHVASDTLIFDARNCELFDLDLPPGKVPNSCWTHNVLEEDLVHVSREVARARAQRTLLDTEFRLQLPTGLRYLKVYGRFLYGPGGEPYRMVGVNFDLTEQRLLEQQLLQAQKLESVGRLAGGVAHDFNNLLTVVLGYSDLVLRKLPEGSIVRPHVKKVCAAAERGAALTQQLLAFARKQIIQPQSVDLNELMHSSEGMLRRLIGEDVELVTRPEPTLGRVRVDPGHMMQCLINLVINARDAMPHGGQVVVETGNLELNHEVAAGYGLEPGSFAQVSICDTGTGIDPQTLPHIFEPFFTTKEQGKGTGLGLATCFGIVKQSGGHLWVDTTPGEGSCFRMLLPHEQGTLESPPSVDLGDLPRGTEAVLLVEDDILVRTIAKMQLQRLGYRVLEAANGVDAELLLEEYDGELQLLITDVVMPRMGGNELARRLRARFPDMRVLFISGYPVEAHEAELHSSLQKPFRGEELALKLREVLDRA